MQLFLVLAFCLSTVAVSADPGNDACVWALLSDVQEKAESSQEFAELQAKYPTYFSGYSAENVTSAHIRVRKMEFIGGTICDDNDPRLFAEVAGYGLCEEANGQGHCFQVPIPELSEKDPCKAN